MSLPIHFGTSTTATGLSGMRTAKRKLDTSAHDIAKLQSAGCKRQSLDQVAQPGLGSVNAEPLPAPGARRGDTGGDAFAHLADDLVGQRMGLYGFAANLKTAETEDRMPGTLLDTRF